jgi:ABC-type uncharacterized transport system involved in gliding motility auxiliary subunit
MRLKGSSNMAAAVLLVLVLCVVITLLSSRHYFKWDVTATKEHTLSEKTLQVLKTIREPVVINAFVQEEQAEARKVKRLLGAYRYHAPGITFELIDPDRNPAMANRYKVKALNTLVLEGYGSTQTVKIPDEEGVTNALIRLSKGQIVKVYTLSGHGERPFKGSDPESLSRLQEDLSRENLEFHDLNLMKTDVPGDASLVMAAAPVKPLFKEEIESLRNYLHRGGNLVIFLEPFIDAGLEGFLKEHGIIISADVILDKMSRVMGGDYLMPMVVNYGVHEITRDFRFPCFFPMARSVETAQEKNKDIKAMALAFTSTNAWAETDQKTLREGKAGFDGQDRRGPISLAVIAELQPPPAKDEGRKAGEAGPRQNSPGKGRLVVFGDVDFVSNKFLNLSGNEDFISNTINYLVGRQDLLTIQKEQRPAQTLMLTRRQGQVLFWVPVVFIPLLVLAAGMVVWNRRRSR